MVHRPRCLNLSYDVADINVAEFMAIIWALRRVEGDYTLLSDASFLIDKNWKRHKGLQNLMPQFLELMQNRNVNIMHINRKENLAGKKLERDNKRLRKDKREVENNVCR
jgi:ribonuclease HI